MTKKANESLTNLQAAKERIMGLAYGAKEREDGAGVYEQQDRISSKLFEIKVEKTEIDRSTTLRAQLIDALTDQLNDIDRREQLCSLERDLERKDLELHSIIRQRNDMDNSDKAVEVRREGDTILAVKPRRGRKPGTKVQKVKENAKVVSMTKTVKPVKAGKRVKSSTRHIKLSAEARERIVAAQAKRWASVRKEKKLKEKESSVKAEAKVAAKAERKAAKVNTTPSTPRTPPVE